MSARTIDLPESEVTSTATKARRIEVDDKDISRFRSLVSAPIKGLAKGAVDLGKLAYIFTDPTNLLGKHIMPLFEKAEQKIEENIPTQPEALEKGLERFGRLVPTAAGQGVSGLVRAGIGATAGQVTEELGGGPLAQGIAETVPFASPSFARKIVPSNAEQKAILDLGRKHGLSEKQLAPMMPESLKRRSFGKFASTGEKTGEQLKQMKRGGSTIYEAIKTSPEAQKFLSPQETQKFAAEMNKLGQDMPHAVRSQLKNDAADLVAAAQSKSGISGSDLMNFYKDVSSRYNIGRSELELFKGPIKKAISSIDPELAKNFDTANKMWARQAKISATLRPGEYDGIVDLGEAYATAAAIGTGDVGLLTKIIGYTGARRAASAMLTSPRLQNLIQQSQNALVKHNLTALKKLGEEIMRELEEEDD